MIFNTEMASSPVVPTISKPLKLKKVHVVVFNVLSAAFSEI